MDNKKRTWKFWTGRALLLLLVLGGLWLTNLIWFKPFSINHFYEKVFIELVLDSPELTTELGIPVIYNWSKDELDDISDAKQWESFNKSKQDYETLLSYDYDKQSPENQLNTDILAYYMKINVIESEPFSYYGYPVNQLFGTHSSLPSMMSSSHKLNDESDIQAYISRLSQFDTKFSQRIENLRIRESKGIIPPRFINKLVLEDLKGFIGLQKDSLGNLPDTSMAITSNILYTNFETKVAEIDISDDKKSNYKKQVFDTIENVVFPAYQSLIVYFENLNHKATNDAGVWKFPNGKAYYRYRLKKATTLDLDPEEIYAIGLSEVARIKQEMNAILETVGYADSTKTIGEIIQKLNQEERFMYPNNDEGHEMILRDFDSILIDISQGLDLAFSIRPKAKLEVKRVPVFREAGASLAYYQGPAMDGSRGGIFYINLRAPNEVAKFGMKTLAYHEGIPGHHFQIAIQNELEGLPTFRNVIPFKAYGEGWALYTEQLAWELGFYENDPFGNLGRLQAEMLRSVRLVVDAGIHYKKWTREEAIDYMVTNTGLPTNEITTEVERYIVTPGQACSYKVGMMKLLELREKAKQELGKAFDLRKFHNAVLKNGSVPLTVLEKIIDDYISATLENSNS
ncbi:DUF885 domain-containing protein [Cognatitamlana onchidii]|uniref:DUF885 domain-containing protein n=1 Tax=Cognatitamlana onchidii TaxID=2562860 RepID=UPI0010A69C59|nr:DUF885 domain-containing protein [Algibacter onchidii]